ncbi:MAG: 3-phosphoserine/phosphohydroxythreonine transaminase [Armatimonadetes bacterium]|nr:3-phosphoserine/phosphohydroxythreonine transaminase [Armatimonadota bacterium]MDE2206796.1 3-phosphoserine/phosphohydroxythreonine transaminase [Armatimonadota bacterium]
MKRIYNFSAGPAVLPESVLAEAAAAVREIGDSGMSILEVSHRGKVYDPIHEEASAAILRVLGLDETEYQPLFLGGGASLQFAMVPMNFLADGQTADYVDTGTWAIKAIDDAKLYGQVNIAASSSNKRYSYVPRNLKLTPNARYLHITTNNTIEGTEWPAPPKAVSVPLVADMSSDIFARDLNYSAYDLIYAGAQKNAGPAGVTLVVIRKSFLAQANSGLPAMLSYATHAKGKSLYNTPPVFGVYVVGLVLKWIEEQGGIAAIEARNREKADIIYAALDEFPHMYEPAVTQKSDRSLMNITFRMRNPDLEPLFLDGARERRMEGLKGHRSVGGIRASVYNAFPLEGCYALAEYLGVFAARHA